MDTVWSILGWNTSISNTSTLNISTVSNSSENTTKKGYVEDFTHLFKIKEPGKPTIKPIKKVYDIDKFLSKYSKLYCKNNSWIVKAVTMSSHFTPRLIKKFPNLDWDMDLITSRLISLKRWWWVNTYNSVNWNWNLISREEVPSWLIKSSIKLQMDLLTQKNGYQITKFPHLNWHRGTLAKEGLLKSTKIRKIVGAKSIDHYLQVPLYIVRANPEKYIDYAYLLSRNEYLDSTWIVSLPHFKWDWEFIIRKIKDVEFLINNGCPTNIIASAPWFTKDIFLMHKDIAWPGSELVKKEWIDLDLVLDGSKVFWNIGELAKKI